MSPTSASVPSAVAEVFLGEKELAPRLCAEGAVCGFGGGCFGAGASSPPSCGCVNVYLRIAKRKFLGDCSNSWAGVVLEIIVQLEFSSLCYNSIKMPVKIRRSNVRSCF